MRDIKKILPLLLFLFSVTVLAGEKPLSNRVASYNISVKLNPVNKFIIGDEVITFRNISDKEISELWLHLYWNAFKDENTVAAKESPGLARRLKKNNGWGYVGLESINLKDGRELLSKAEILGDVMKLSLSEPLSPGKEIHLRIKFKGKIPKGAPRAGYVGNFYFISQWFPKMGVLLPDGRFVCNHYHMPAEFFADFGIYRVAITVPVNYLVGASGYPVSEEEHSDGTKTLTFYGEDIHDFAWTASPEMLVTKERYKDTEIIFLYQPAHKDQVDRHLKAAKGAMEFFDNWLGPYPYPRLTVVDPPRGSTAGGMEYPTLITAGTTWFLHHFLPGILLPEVGVVHEFGHQYWYGMVANDETEEAWLDEGINTYSEARALEAIYGADNELTIGRSSLNAVTVRRLEYLLSPRFDPIIKPSWEFYPGAYGAMAYSRGALSLKTLENYLGREKLDNILRTFFEQYRFKHPSSADFFRVANEVAGEDLSPFFNQLWYKSGDLDYAVGVVRNKKEESGDKGNKRYNSEVFVLRKGELVLPVEVEIAFSDGKKIMEKWSGKERYHKFSYQREAEVSAVTVDPEGKIPLDIDTSNNSKVLNGGRTGVLSLFVRTSTLLEHFLFLIASLS
jgi:hypothetical protein